MKQELPTSARKALARQAAAEAHPSADLLSGFVEHALSAAEKERVTTHLASCAECREVVFLAGAAAAEEQQTRQEHPAAAAARRLPWASWKWLAPALATVAIVAGIIVERSLIPSNAKPHAPASTVAMNAPQPALPTANNAADEVIMKRAQPAAASRPRQMQTRKATPPERETQLDRSRAPAQQAVLEKKNKTADAEAAAPPPPAITAEAATAPGSTVKSATAANEVNLQSAGRNEITAKALPSTAPSAAAAPRESAKTSGAISGAFGAGLALARRDTPAALRWRITDDGHLERSSTPGEWTRVLAELPISFHSVAVIGSDVWAGGSDGALFHTSDGGEHWSRVELTSGGQTEAGNIQSIRFNTPLQGSVITNSGATWSTSDGGKTWAHQ
ncbi:MAG TPA: YCF48-related protein [Terriglobales bacterium]|nr:YCF48-related protein [Terriglobales bacterium]